MDRSEIVTRGWGDPATARAYAAFAQRDAMYRETSRDLVRLAEVHGDQVVVDLACGTGVTTEEVLTVLGPSGQVFALDSSPAMLGQARAAIDDPRVHWIEAPAEALAKTVGAADVVVCNSAIWQTDMAAVFAAVGRILAPGGRFVFNIGRRFWSCRLPTGS